MVSAIRDQFGAALPIASLIEEPTIEGLAQILERQVASPYHPLVQLKAGGGRRPLFLVHPVGGDVLTYVELSRLLPGELPVYGLRAPGLQDGTRPLDRIEDLAALYTGAMREAQPGGPYLLAGWSFGGRVALEAARRLREQGEWVDLVIFDTDVEPVDLAALPERDDIESICQWMGERLPITRDELRRVAPERRVEHVYDLARIEGVVPPAFSLDDARRQLAVARAHQEAGWRHAPRPYPGPVSLFRAADNRQAPGADPALGWGRLVRAGLEVHTVPGTT